MEQAYKVGQYQIIAIGGRYMTSLAMAKETLDAESTVGAVSTATIKILDEVITKAKAK